VRKETEKRERKRGDIEDAYDSKRKKKLWARALRGPVTTSTK